MRILPKGELMLPQVKDTPPDPTSRISDKDADGQDILQVTTRCAEARQTGGAPQLVDIGGEVETYQRESL